MATLGLSLGRRSPERVRIRTSLVLKDVRVTTDDEAIDREARESEERTAASRERNDRSPTDQLEVTENASSNWPVIVATGEIDIWTAPLLSDAIDGVLARGDRLVIDLTAVEFMDSTALAVLLAATERVTGGGVRVVVTHPRLLRLFELTGMPGVLQLFASVEEATGDD